MLVDRRDRLFFCSLLLALSFCCLLSACRPTEPELIVVTEVVRLGEEQIIITRLVELLPTPTNTPEPPAKVPMPITLDLAFQGVLPQLDPQQAREKVSYDLVENLFVGLTNFNHENQQVEPELAESWSISTDGMHWTFQLRDDIHWIMPSDPPTGGSEQWSVEPVRAVDAFDVVRAIRRICTRETATRDAFIFFIIEGCEQVYGLADPAQQDLETIGATATDATTLQISLTRPASYFLTMTALPQMRPVPSELIDEHGDQWRLQNGDLGAGWQTPANIMSSGPFIPSLNAASDSELVLYSNPLWPLSTKGNIDTVNIAFQQDELEIYDAWRAKIIDMSVLPVEVRDEFLSQTPSKAQLTTNQTVFYLGFNFDSPVFSDPVIRQAFGSAIDREQLTSDMFDDRAQALRHLTSPGTFGSPPIDEVGVGYSPDYARHQMDQSGFRSCKLIPPITFQVSTADLSLLQAELIRSMWINELDCDEDLINIEQSDFGTLLANTSAAAGENRPDMWELAWPSSYPDAHNTLSDLLHCSEGENRQNRACSEADRLLRQASLTPQIEERQALYRQVENLFFGESGIMPVIPLYVRGDYTLVQSWLTYTPALSGGEQFDTYVIDEELKRLEQSRSR